MSHEEKRTQWKQWAATFIASMPLLCCGAIQGWATTTLPRLMDNDSPMPITSDQSSWIVSLTYISGLIGSIIGVVFGDAYGRKNCLILSGFIYIVGFVTTIIASGVRELYMARFILGSGTGIAYTICPVYLSEIVDVNIRGASGTIPSVELSFGFILACVIGPFVSIKELTIILLSIPIIFIFGFVWFPETPSYLASKGRHEEAARSLAFFKGIGKIESAREDLKIVLRNMNQEAERSTWKEKLLELRLPSNRKGLQIVVYLMIANVFTGSIAIQAYLSVLFRKADINMNPDVATLMVLVASFLSCGAGTVLIERTGRRPLLIVSCLGTSATLAILGTYLLLHDNGLDLAFINWLPIAVTFVSQAFYQIGLGIVPKVLVGEFFPITVKGIASSTMVVASLISSAFTTKLHQLLSDALGNCVPFYFFACCTLLALVYVLFVVPESKNRTVRDIQEDLAQIRFVCCGRSGKLDLESKIVPRE